MMAEVREAAGRLKFLMDYAVLPDDDIKLNSQTFNWPGRMEPIFDVSQHRLTAKREVVENELKKKYAFLRTLYLLISIFVFPSFFLGGLISKQSWRGTNPGWIRSERRRCLVRWKK